MNNCRNLRYICDGCLRSFDGLKTLTKPILDKNDEIELEIKNISEHTTALCKDFCELKQLVVANGDRLNQINSVDNKSFDNFKQQMNESWTGIVKQGIKNISEHTTALCKDFCELKQLVVANGDRLNQINSVDNKSFDNFKQQMNESWTGIVKQGIDAVKNDVKVVQRTLEMVNTIKERENNVIILNLIEFNRKDNDSVSAILRSLTDNFIKDDNILRVTRQGRKIGDSKTPRPVIVKFASFVIKNRVMRSISKIKSLEGEFNKIKISHDLTRDQRVELRELIAEAKTKEANDGHFLYRVRGQVGRWKIVKLQKTAIIYFLQVLRPHDPYHGGLIVFFKKMFKARKIEVPVFQTFEAIIVEFSFKRRKVFVFGIYRPGSKLVTSLFFGELTSVLEHLFALGDGLIVAGDFNIHIERPGDTHSINLLEIFDSFQLTNVVNEPTHNLGGTLDLVASTPDIPLFNCRVDPSGAYSDHGLINVSFSPRLIIVFINLKT
ncbi:hypothetical protein HELRODRAFT_164071 [Helobdella robusta]|uniref:Endonuclease/exonuclease/phosphatase domain-containing protein n=1 Tax=Helobdella robusta TaxID=6412 RepID=T1EUV6_HELRO|nr:hypothetical protein HELRODRAFT_164071 [Helobdella robusta]ESN94264.1 hypothetical protein HELRODRAFT_164071 [Helobdella robusta]